MKTLQRLFATVVPLEDPVALVALKRDLVNYIAQMLGGTSDLIEPLMTVAGCRLLMKNTLLDLEGENSMATVQVPSVGRVVHYILNHGPSEGQHRPAMIVRVWGNTPDSAVQLQVFTDKDNDREECVVWRTSVKYAEPHLHELGTWHWPEYVPAVPAEAPVKAMD